MFRRHRRGKHTDFVEPDLPITPMLDMSFQLLAFFVMTYSPTDPEGHMDMSLPKREGGAQSVEANPNPTDEPEELTIEVDSDQNGAQGTMRLKKDGLVLKEYPDNKTLFDDLKARLAAGGAGAKPAKVKLEMGETLRYSAVITLMDTVQRAGYKQVAPALFDPKAGKK